MVYYGLETVLDSWHVVEESPPVFTRIYYVLSGDVTYCDEARTFKLQKGFLYLFPTNKPYEILQNLEDKLCCLYCDIYILPYMIPEPVCIDLEKDAIARHVILALKGQMESEAEVSGEALEESGRIVEDLTMVLVRHIHSLGYAVSMPEPLVPAMEYINGHYRQEISVETLAGACGYHEKYFAKIFKEHVGVSPYRYLLNYRMNVACNLLLQGHSVGSTAVNCGYPDLKSFCRGFKQQFGVTPKKYHRLIRLP